MSIDQSAVCYSISSLACRMSIILFVAKETIKFIDPETSNSVENNSLLFDDVLIA